MKRWLLHILISLACMWLSSCQNDVMMPDEDNGKVEVPLEIAIAGGDGTTSRGFEDGGTDPDTDDQKSMTKDDVFVLVFQNDRLIDQVKGLELLGTDGNATRELTGVFTQPANTSNIELVVLANLVQNNLKGITNNSTLLGIQAAIDGWSGFTKEQVYQNLIYQYDASPGNWAIGARRIPMWGTTGEQDFTKANHLETSCNLHRAVAKLGFRINDDAPASFALTRATIKGAMNEGYCAPLNTSNLGNDNYFTSPFIPSSVNGQTITYTLNNVTDSYENKIYLPEQAINFTPLTIEKGYSLNATAKSATVNFDENVIRNHSYIYNITIKEDLSGNIKTDILSTVEGWNYVDVGSDYE